MGSGFMLSYKLVFSWTISVHKSFTLFFSLLFLQWKPLCGAQEMLQLLVRGCSEQQCSALMPIVQGTALSSTHLCWQPCDHSWLFTVKAVLTNLSLFSFTRPVFLMYTSPFILQRSVTGVFLCAVYTKGSVQMLP